MTTDPTYQPEGMGPSPLVKSGRLPAPFPIPANYQEAPPLTDPGLPVARRKGSAAPKASPPPAEGGHSNLTVSAASVDLTGSGFYLDRGRWAAINPSEHQSASLKLTNPVRKGRYNVTLHVVGESDGNSSFEVLLGFARGLPPMGRNSAAPAGPA